MSKTQLIHEVLWIASSVIGDFSSAEVTYERGKGFWIDIHDRPNTRYHFRTSKQALTFIAGSIQARRIVASMARH
jgi:hypothetical protein